MALDTNNTFSATADVIDGVATRKRKIILSINAGSSSVKISVYTAEFGEAPRQIAETQINGLTAPPPTLDYSRGGRRVFKGRALAEPVANQDAAFGVLLRTLVEDGELGEIGGADDIRIVSHRIVHGGDYARPALITADTLQHLEKLNDLAPLHNAPSLAIVRTCLRRLPRAVNVACFDSQFHATMPLHIRTYPIDQAIARKNQLRKFGFHGISYAFITRAVADHLGRPAADLNIIALHLGSGASACAIRDGKSWDTSMGLTPLAGLPGATRSGSIDPSLVFHYASDVGKLSPASTRDLHISTAEEILNREAGWKSLTGTTNFGIIAAGAAEPAPTSSSEEDKHATHRLAFDLFVDRVCGFVGAYYVSLGGRVDALVFAGGIGEHSDRLRAAVVGQCACLGFALDPRRNDAAAVSADPDVVVQDVGADPAACDHRVLVCRTDEQFEMARYCAEDKLLWG